MLRIRTFRNKLSSLSIILWSGQNIYWSNDYGNSFTSKTVLDSADETVVDADISQGGDYIIFTSSKGKVCFSSDKGQTFRSIVSTYGETCCIDEAGKKVIYLYYYNWSSSHPNSSLYISDDFGLTFSQKPVTPQYFEKMIFRNNGNTIIGARLRTYGVSDMYRSADGASSWEQITAGGDNLYFDTDKEGRTIIQVDWGDYLRVSKDHGESFVDIKRVTSECLCAAIDSNTMYYTSGRNLYKSSDGGTNWSNVATLGSRGNEINNLSHSMNGNLIVASLNTNIVYASLDGGSTFSEILTTTNTITGIKIKG